MNRATQVIAISGIVLVLFLTSGITIIKNLVTVNNNTEYQITVPASSTEDVSLSQEESLASLLASNQTDALHETLQQNVLATSTDISMTKSTLSIMPTLEKIDQNGVIRDRILLPKLNAYITNQDSNEDLKDYRVRITLDVKSDSPAESTILSGKIITKINNVEFSTSEFSINGITDDKGEATAKFGTLNYFEMPYSSIIPVLKDGLNSFEIRVSSLKGSVRNSAFDVSDVQLYKSDIEYSQFKIISKNEQGSPEKVYPKDSSITIGSVEGRKITVDCDWTGFYTPCRTTVRDQGLSPAPTISMVKVSDANGNVIFSRDSMYGMQKIALERNAKFHVMIADPPTDYFVQTPEDRSVDYVFSCVLDNYVINKPSNVICGHP